jgi:catechol 2,3-dioxygenase-like lactoylglutathione lyase family enzyme
MAIRKLFHFMHIVDDFDATSARYDALFAPHVYAPKHWSDFDKRWASLAVVGPDFVLEIMEPSKEPDDGGSPLPKFHRRHGDHLHSFAWFVDAADHKELARRMLDAGVRVVTPYGSLDGEDGKPGASTFFTHPKDTFGQLELQSWTPEGGGAPHTSPDWDATFWSDEHPLGLLGMSHLTTVVTDLERTKAFYEGLLDAPAFFEETTDDRTSAYALVGDDTVVEIAQPTTEGSRLARDLAAHGELPHAMTFRVRDLDAARRHVEGIGVRVEHAGDTITLDPDDMHHAVVAFTTRQLPGDPRR